MKGILAKLTVNRFMGVGTGALVTAVIQSSSVTTVLVVGFISAGLMSLSQSVGVIMGANIGTTITAQIVAFKITKAALGMIAVGFAMLFIAKNDRTKHYGEMLMGLGMVFFGMHVMSEAMEPLRSYQPFLDLMKTMDNPLVGVLIATAFTALIQSSSASTGIVIVMASQGFISLQAGIALAFGANIGTCATALLAVIGKPREAVRAALVHLFFNVCGVLIWLPFIGFIANLVTAISPSYPDLSGAARLAAETPRQIANAHTFFNVANTLIFIWFTTQIARLVEWLVPDKPLEEEAHHRAHQVPAGGTVGNAVAGARPGADGGDAHGRDGQYHAASGSCRRSSRATARRSRPSGRWTTRSTSCTPGSSITSAASASSRSATSRRASCCS
jgi:phosphate:Na+ symporter